jgi:hypothetical protein
VDFKIFQYLQQAQRDYDWGSTEAVKWNDDGVLLEKVL